MLELNHHTSAAKRLPGMAHRKTSKRFKARSMLRLADLEQSLVIGVRAIYGSA